jgi:hypothetical protein
VGQHLLNLLRQQPGSLSSLQQQQTGQRHVRYR